MRHDEVRQLWKADRRREDLDDLDGARSDIAVGNGRGDTRTRSLGRGRVCLDCVDLASSGAGCEESKDGKRACAEIQDDELTLSAP